MSKLRLGRQHRPCRDGAERARRRQSRSGARRDPGGSGRRRRHHRASARRPPAYFRRRYRPPRARAENSAQSGNGGDRRDAGHRAASTARMPPASCRRSARSAPPRAASMRRASTIACKPIVATLARCRHPRLAVHRARPRQLDAAQSLGAPVVELHTGAYANAAGDAARRRCSARSANAADIRRIDRAGNPCRPRPHLSTMSGPSPPFREIRELNIGHFLIGEAIFVGLAESIQRMRAPDGRGAGHDPRPRLRPDRHPPHRKDASRRMASVSSPASSPRSSAPNRTSARPAPPPMPSVSPPRRPAPRRWAPGFAGRVLARHGGGQSARRQADHGADRRRAEAAGGNHARRATGPRSTSPSPTIFRWPRPS